MPCRGAWPHLKEVDAEFGKQGLRVLALSDEEQSAVEPYVDQMDLPFLVASGSSSGDAYGVTGIPHTFLIDAQGTLVWEGSPGDLSKATIKKALKGAKRPKVDHLSVRMEGEVDKRVEKARDLAADGDLAPALKEIETILADPKSEEAQKKGATELKQAIEIHAQRLAAQAEKLLKAREVQRAVTVLEDVAAAMPGSEVGADAKKRLAAVASDEKLQAELDASKALDRLKDQIRPLKRDKAKPKIEEFIKKYQGTRAGDRAANLLKTTATKG